MNENNNYDNLEIDTNQLNNFTMEMKNEYGVIINFLWYIFGMLSMIIIITLVYFIYHICNKKNKISGTAETVPLLNTIEYKIDELKEVIVDVEKINDSKKPENLLKWKCDQTSVMSAYT